MRPPRGAAARAFTLIELLIVVAILILLTLIIAGVATSAVNAQKVTLTRNIMRTIDLAIQQFATEDPLGSIYNNRRKNPLNLPYPPFLTFGPYPPYQLAGSLQLSFPRVRTALEPYTAGAPGPLDPPSDLEDRLWRDLGNRQGSPNDYVVIDTRSDPEFATNNDIRALYAYLSVFDRQALAQVPETAKKPLTDRPEYVHADGRAQSTNDEDVQGRMEVLGFHDAWGVPLDYFLMVKLEWTVLANGAEGLKVTDRVPVLRSRGISKEKYEKDVVEPARWIFSEEFRSPAAGVNENGGFTGGTAGNGWARAVATGDDYGYVPKKP